MQVIILLRNKAYAVKLIPWNLSLTSCCTLSNAHCEYQKNQLSQLYASLRCRVAIDHWIPVAIPVAAFPGNEMCKAIEWTFE